MTSAPDHSKSNGAAEGAVQTVKEFFSKNVLLSSVLLNYRDTPQLSYCSTGS